MPAPRYVIRPLGPWDRPLTENRRAASTFQASWDDTLKLLLTEVGNLGAEQVVLQVDVTEGELRRDGMLRTHARVNFPGVKVSFASTHGTLMYATDAYERFSGSKLTSWQANVRAIALGLEALRAVDRYGITRSGEQYRGWTAIQSKAAEHKLTIDEAARVLADAAGISASTLERSAAVLANGRTKTPTVARESVREARDIVEAAYRKAVKVCHPDHGGNPDVFRLVTVARGLLIGA